MIASLYRFHGHNSLRYVYSNGKAVRSKFATIKWVTNTHRRHSRIAIVVSKKVIKSAVSRNRIRRRLYEYMRPRLPQLTQTYDIVVIVTLSEFLTMPTHELTAQMDELITQTPLFKTV